MRSAIVLLFLAGCSASETTPPTADAATDTGAAAETSADTGVADTGRPDPWDGGPPSAECVTHCECMKENCAKYSRYPYKTDKDCTDHCGAFTAPEYKCWFYFCGEAKTATSNNEHWCEHAWGTWGLEECPK